MYRGMRERKARMWVRSELDSFVLYQKRFLPGQTLAKAVGVNLILTSRCLTHATEQPRN
jgi:hypothetical protein